MRIQKDGDDKEACQKFLQLALPVLNQ